MPAKKQKKAKPKKPGVRKQSAAPQSAAPPLADALAESAWRQADDALAEAMSECDALETASSTKARAAALALLKQAVVRAGRRRGLSLVGELGARERFDAKLHETAAEAAKMPRMVRIQTRVVKRGGEVLRRARVTPAASASGRRRKNG